MKHEGYISELEEAIFPSTEAMDAGADALSFVVNLNNELRANGADLPETPDIDKLGSVLDSIFAEIAAASIFLSEDVFVRVPKMLRGIADAFDKEDANFKDPTGEVAPSVPKAVVTGYRDLAKRIEAARVQKVHLIETLKKYRNSQDTP